MLEELREVAGLGGPACKLANDILVLRQNYEDNLITLEQYQTGMEEIATVRAKKELPEDNESCSYIIVVAKTLSTFI
jgi:hypothetical protein